MKKSVVLLPRCAVVASVALTVVACSLNTSGLAPSASRGGGDAATGTLPSGALDDASATAADTGAPTTSGVDAAAPVDAADAAPEPLNCDVDGDGHLATGAACGGDDCCDADPLTAPGQTAFFQTPNGCGSFDYDCDGAPEPEVGVAMCKLSFLSCDGDGFSAPTPCGAQGDFVSCSFAGVGCSESRKLRTQSCR